MKWERWIGKPHCTGADPGVDEGCDCLIMVVRVRQELGLPVPGEDEMREMISLARVCDHAAIHARLDPHLQRVEHPSPGAFTVFETQDHIGAAVMVEGGVLHVSKDRGVRWLPGYLLRRIPWYDWHP